MEVERRERTSQERRGESNRRKSCVRLRVVVVCEGCMNITILISFDRSETLYEGECEVDTVLVFWEHIERPRIAQRRSRKSCPPVALAAVSWTSGLSVDTCACTCYTVLRLLDLTLRFSYMY